MVSTQRRLAAMADDQTPYHAHIYYTAAERPAAEALRETFIRHIGVDGGWRVAFVGRAMDQGVGPHPQPQYEIHFHAPSLGDVIANIEASGLRALVHPLTDDDLADHTSLGRWIGEPLDLDLTVL